MKFGLEFVPGDLYWRTTYYAIQAEKTGFEYIWITDHFNNRNVYTTLAVIANYTSEIKLGPGVTSPYLIHPMMTAQAVASLNEIAPGRVVCGLGAGDKTTLRMLNIKQVSPLSAVKESVEIIRSISSNRDATIEGKVFKIQGAKLNFSVSNEIPIYVGAQGPKMLALAAEIGDGVLINASHRRDIEYAFQNIRIGMEKAGKRQEDLDVVAYTSFSVHKKTENAVKAAVPIVAFIVAGSPKPLLERHGIDPEQAEKISAAISQADWKEAFSSVTTKMIDAFSVCGTPEECVEKIKELEKLGVTQFVMGSPVGPRMRKAIKTVQEEIMLHFE
jgi:5,10-methylenetetrahydromethanopterin reductase